MNVFVGMVFYMFVGGLALGLGINGCHNETGKTYSYSDVDFFEAAIWPVAIGFMVVDDNAFINGKACNNTNIAITGGG